MTKISTGVTIEKDLKTRAAKQGINISYEVNMVLNAILNTQNPLRIARLELENKREAYRAAKARYEYLEKRANEEEFRKAREVSRNNEMAGS